MIWILNGFLGFLGYLGFVEGRTGRSRTLKGLVIMMSLVLVWLALDDITTGSEPEVVGEWMVVVLGLLSAVGVGFSMLRDRRS